MAGEVHYLAACSCCRPTKKIIGVVRKQLGLSFLGESRNAREYMTLGDIHMDGLDRSVCVAMLSMDLSDEVFGLDRLGIFSVTGRLKGGSA